ncbi:Potassium channel [Entomortierella beljakovae]|nr:Potassium channel [Entomortierella beljakovae]
MWNPPAPEIQISNSARRNNAPKRWHNDGHAPDYLNNENHINLGHNDGDLNYNRPPVPYLVHTTTLNRASVKKALPHPKLEKVGPYMTIATLQAYTILTVVRCVADPGWIVLRSGKGETPTRLVEIGSLERVFLSCAIGFTILSCAGVTLRIMDRMLWLRRIPVITAYLEAALISFLAAHTPLPEGAQFSHGFLACIITAVFATIVAIMLTVDWWRGFPSAGLSATLKALIISSFFMTIVIIVGAAIYTGIEGWSFDQAVNFCIVSFATIGYGDISPETKAGMIVFFFYGILGISSMGFFVVSLRNAVIEQFQWRLLDKFQNPAHLTRVQTRMSAKDISFPEARFEEEQRVKSTVKRKMIGRMGLIWIFMWFGGAGVFCAFETWTYLESLYFCFVTLTTIGFGDFVPTQPGSIEFWNVYVFIGLSVFAYILSLSSESMAQHIHLVDDRDDDDSMYGWERNEDPNAPLTTRSTTLGLEGLKWHQNQQNIQHPLQLSREQTIGEGKMTMSSNFGSNTTNDFDGDNVDSVPSSAQLSRHRERSHTGRILTVSAKERRQMLQAEYYAAHSLPSSTTTIRFVDTKGAMHEKTFGTNNSRPESINGDDQPAPIQGYYGTMGQKDYEHLKDPRTWRRHETLPGAGVGGYEVSYNAEGSSPPNTVQTRQLQHRPFIKFNSPIGSVHSSQHRGNQDSQTDSENQIERSTRAIPSCLDLFTNPNRFSNENIPMLDNNKWVQQKPQFNRVRSSSYDSHMPGPSQNEIHRWLAEDAGTLDAPEYMSEYKALEQELDKEFNHSPKDHGASGGINPILDTTRLPQNFGSGSEGGDGQSLQESKKIRSSFEGVPPDVIPACFTMEPEEMNSNELDQFHSGNTVDVEAQSLETSPIHQESADQKNFNNLNMGGDDGAGYGEHGYGSLMQPTTITSTPTPAPTPIIRLGSSSSSIDPHPGPSEPIQLFDEDNDTNQLTLRRTNSQPRSLFSNHPRSGQHSTSGSPAGSVSSIKSPPVLMTIFDVPVLDLPLSRSSTRNGSPIIPKPNSSARSSIDNQRSARSSVDHRRSTMSQKEFNGIENNDNPGESRGSVSSSLSQNDDGKASPSQELCQRNSSQSSLAISVGPFDETRSQESIPRFDQDVDLNLVEPSSQIFEEELQRRKELKRREKEIEARLARLGAKGRADYG